MHWWFGGLRWRLILLIVVAFVPAIALMVWHGLERRDRGAEDMRAQTLNLARLAAQEQQRRLEGARQLLIALSTSSTIRADDSAACTRDVRALVREYRGLYSEIGWADRQGRVMCHALEGDNLSIADRQYFQAALATESFVVGELIVGKISGIPVLAFSHPLRDSAGGIRGVLFANVDLRVLSQSLEPAARESGGIISILDRTGAIVARSSEAARFIGVKASREQLAVMYDEGELVRSFLGPDGQWRQYAMATVVDADERPALFVNYGRSEADALDAVAARFRDDLTTILFLAIGTIAAALIGAEWLVRRPLHQLLDATAALGAGRLSTRATPVGSTTEFAALASAFNTMAEQLEQRDVHLREGQRLEAIGQLAGGIAHDFNNLLTIIIGYASSLEEQIRTSESGSRDLAELRAAAEKAASLTHQLLAFSRRQLLQPKPVQINRVVSQMQSMLRRTIGREISLTVLLEDNLAIVRADRAQLEQVILNLVINARDAMPNGGVIEIATRNCVLPIDNREALPPGEYVQLTVSDDGTGIDPQTRARIFEPFFTTKGPRGTGLGLATVYGVVTQSGGAIRCDSTEGAGTRFEIVLPKADVAVETKADKPGASAAGGTERILVVEDDPAVRTLIVATLARRGYDVTSTEDGLSALAVIGRGPRVDLLITDVRMPRMNGLALYDEIQQIHPGMAALLISGDSAPEVPLGPDGQRPRFLQKPFTVAQLLDAAREALSDVRLATLVKPPHG
ncbi:MAG TPA: ATP-binding protein [Vicinamibacterales bacterium]|nr:ATP-binding protein [Vicinamibacterales bacterium]